MEPLGSAKLKVDRANIHINALKRSVRRSFNPQCAIREKAVLDGTAKLIDVDIDPSLRAESWGLIIGDIVANLRASLDHIAWSLALLHIRETSGKALTRDQAKTVQFPLYDNMSALDKSIREGRALKFVLPRAHSKIKRFQPYNRRDWPELNLLRDLQLLSNADKHCIVTPCNVRSNVSLTRNGTASVMILNNQGNAKFLAFSGTNLEPNITHTIAVYPRDSLHPMSIDAFPLIHDFIRDEVIPAFACFFK